MLAGIGAANILVRMNQFSSKPRRLPFHRWGQPGSQSVDLIDSVLLNSPSTACTPLVIDFVHVVTTSGTCVPYTDRLQ